MTDRVALVTGGLRGLGRAMVLGLARAGHRVAAVGHIAADIGEVEAEARALGVTGQVWPLVADLREPRECDRVVAETRHRFGRIDILVNNAGLTFTYIDPDRYRRPEVQRFWQVSDEIVENVMATNVLAADRLSRRVAPAWSAQGWGRIVNVTTKLDTMNRIGTHPYGASKAALEMATEVWAKDAAGTGLTINIVNPGAGANTPGMADEMRAMSREGRAAAPRRARRDGAAAALRRLERGRRGQRLPLRRQCLGRLAADRGSRPPRRPPRRVRAAPGRVTRPAQPVTPPRTARRRPCRRRCTSCSFRRKLKRQISASSSGRLLRPSGQACNADFDSVEACRHVRLDTAGSFVQMGKALAKERFDFCRGVPPSSPRHRRVGWHGSRPSYQIASGRCGDRSRHGTAYRAARRGSPADAAPAAPD